MRGTLTSETYALAGDTEEFFTLAESRGWGDGLPLVPPTEERVQAMLDSVDEAPETVLASSSRGAAMRRSRRWQSTR